MKNPIVKLVVNMIAIVFTCAALGLLAGGIVLYHYSVDLPDYSELAHYDPDIVTRLYAGDDRLLAEYAVEKRVYVPLSAVPKRVTEAFVAAEDKDFYTNTGIDLRGMLRAALSNWRALRGGRASLAGGSTITQQVVKNFLLTPEKSLSRKIKEAILAYRITKVYSKDRILELYLNEIYLGKGSYGVASAAINYFNKSLDELTVEEAAMLAALPKEPAHIDPAVHYNIAKERRDYVINRMMEDHYITPDDARAAIATPITLRVRDKTQTASADFFAEEVRRELAAKYGDDALYKGGLFVKTTLDPVLQGYSDEALRFALSQYDHRKGYRGPLVHVDLTDDWSKQLKAIADKKRWPLFDGERLAFVLQTGKPNLGFEDGKKGSLDKDSFVWAQHKGLSAGDVVIAAPSEKEQFALHQIPEVNGAMIVMDPHTGRVLAMSGGYAYGGTEFNRATQAHRQPGSAFKPFVYLSAMENGFTPATIVVDEPVELPQGNGMPVWRPNNYSEEYLGPAPLRMGLEKSRNAMTVRLASMLGLDKIIETAVRFGIYDKLPEQFSLVLGAQETTLIRLANAYCIIDNGGKKVSPFLIERIDDKDGKTIFRRDTRTCPNCKLDSLTGGVTNPPLPPDDRAQIDDVRANYQVISMLEGVVLRGTGARAAKLGKPLAGKTGTTNDSRDTWFMGFSPDLVAGIYVGYDTPRTLGKKETGASVALPGFIHFMEKALKDTPAKPFRVPPGINFISIDARTGQVPQPGTTDKVILEAFKDGEGPDTQPVEGAGAGQGGIWQGAEPQYQFPAENPDSARPPGVPPAGAVPVQGDEGTGGLY